MCMPQILIRKVIDFKAFSFFCSMDYCKAESVYLKFMGRDLLMAKLIAKTVKINVQYVSYVKVNKNYQSSGWNTNFKPNIKKKPQKMLQ